jgi:hypothetical protein
MAKSPEPERDIDAIFRDGTLIDRAMRRAVNQAIREHRLRGLPMVIQRDDKIIWVPAEEMELLEE